METAHSPKEKDTSNKEYVHLFFNVWAFPSTKTNNADFVLWERLTTDS